MIDKLKPHTSAAWDWSVVGKKDKDTAIYIKVVELTNIMKAKGDQAETFKVYATDRVVQHLRTKLQHCAEEPTAAGEMVLEGTKWLVFRDTSKTAGQKALIRGGQQVALMNIFNL